MLENYEYRHAMLWLLFKWYQDFLQEGLKDIPEVMEATKDYQSDLDLVKPWLKDHLLVTGNFDDYVQVKDLKDKLMEEELYQEMFKKDKDFVNYLKTLYPKCKYINGQKWIAQRKLRNIFTGIKFFMGLKNQTTLITPFNHEFVSNGEKICKVVLKNLYPTYTFSKVRPYWLKNPKTGKELELDFYNEELKIAIEYNGIQHYQFVPDFHKNPADFTNQVERDKYKVYKCKEKEINLITVPYTCNSKETITNFIVEKTTANTS